MRWLRVRITSITFKYNSGVMELVVMQDFESCAVRRERSSRSTVVKPNIENLKTQYIIIYQYLKRYMQPRVL